MGADTKSTATPVEGGPVDDDDSEPTTSGLAIRPPPLWDDDDEPGEDRTEMQMDAELVARARHRLMFGRAKPAADALSTPNAAPPVVEAKRSAVAAPSATVPSRVPAPSAPVAGAPARPTPMRAATKIGMPMPAEVASPPISKRIATPAPLAPEHTAVPHRPGPPPFAGRIATPAPRPPVRFSPPIADEAPRATPAAHEEVLPSIAHAAPKTDVSHQRPATEAGLDAEPGAEEIAPQIEPDVAIAMPMAAATPYVPEVVIPAAASRPASADGTAARSALRRRVRRSRVEWVAIGIASASVLWAIWLLLFYRR